MSLVSTQHSFNNNTNSTTTSATTNSLLASTEVDSNPTHDTEADLSRLLGAFTGSEKSSMERGAPDFQQSGLQSPFSSALNEPQSEESPADHASAAHYPPQHELRPSNPNNYSTSATPTSEFYPASARSSSFPEHIHRNIQSSNHSGSSGAMAQQPTSPSLPLQDGQRNHQNPQIKSDSDVPIDPSIATSSPTYPPNGGQYSPYPPNQEMHHGGYPPQQHPGAMYAQPRPDWAGYGGHPQHVPAGYGVSGAQTPTSAAPAGQRPGQVYSFVPIPGAQQHKRPRRRYEEIERMYKCGWNGCEKAYGTLNHLNAHVTMQSHGIKRTPEEFKEIRKEWKQRKKEEEAQRKAEDERARQAAGGADGQQPDGAAPSGYRQPAQVQLPPLTYQPGSQGPTQYQAPAGGVQQLQEYGQQSHQPMFNGYPASPYGAPNPMYNQHQGNPAGQPQPKYEPHN